MCKTATLLWRKTTAIVVVILPFSIFSCTSLVRPNFSTELKSLRSGQYTLDPQHRFLIFRVDHLNLSKIIGRFNDLEASLDFDPQNPTSLKLSGAINTHSIDLNNNDLEATLQNKSWFDSAQYPQISFDSTGVTSKNNTTLTIDGILSMRGTTQPVTLLATFNGGADNILTRKYTIGFSAHTRIKRSDFGMDTFSAFIGDDIDIEIHGEFQRQ